MSRRSLIDQGAFVVPIAIFAVVESINAFAMRCSEIGQAMSMLAVVLCPAIPGLRVRSLFRLRSDASTGAVAIIVYVLYFIAFGYVGLIVQVGVTGDGP